MPIKENRSKPTGIPGVRQDGPRRFLVRVRWNDPRTGRRMKRELVASSLAEAVALREERKGSAPMPKPTRQRFCDFAEQWMRAHASNLADSTRDRYIDSLAHITTRFGRFYVDAIAFTDIRDWLGWTRKRYAAPTVNGWLRVFRVCLDDAVAAGILPHNPARAVKSLREPRTKGKRGTALCLSDFRAVLQKTQELAGNGISVDLARMIQVVAWTGLRRGELHALKWSDIANGEITVQHSVYKRHEKPTKTDDPRMITIMAPLKHVLDEQRRWLLQNQHPGLKSGLIFPASPRHARAGRERRQADEISWYRSASVLDQPLAKVVQAAGVPPISCHSFRRTFENNLRAAGIDQLVRRAVAGWRTDTAQAIYASVDKGERDRASEAMVALVLGGAGAD